MGRAAYNEILALCEVEETITWWKPTEYIQFPASAVPFVRRLFAPDRSENEREGDLRRILRRLGIAFDEVSNKGAVPASTIFACSEGACIGFLSSNFLSVIFIERLGHHFSSPLSGQTEICLDDTDPHRHERTGRSVLSDQEDIGGKATF